MARLSAAQLRNIGQNISYHGDQGIAVRPATLEALVADATGRHVELNDESMRYVDAFALEALLVIAEAKLKAAQAQPRQTFALEDWTQLPRQFLPTGDLGDGFHVIVKESSERPMNADELARAPRGSTGGTVISVGFPVAVVLATVKNPDKFATRLAQLMTDDTKPTT